MARNYTSPLAQEVERLFNDSYSVRSAPQHNLDVAAERISERAQRRLTQKYQISGKKTTLQQHVGGLYHQLHKDIAKSHLERKDWADLALDHARDDGNYKNFSRNPEQFVDRLAGAIVNSEEFRTDVYDALQGSIRIVKDARGDYKTAVRRYFDSEDARPIVGALIANEVKKIYKEKKAEFKRKRAEKIRAVTSEVLSNDNVRDAVAGFVDKHGEVYKLQPNKTLAFYQSRYRTILSVPDNELVKGLDSNLRAELSRARVTGLDDSEEKLVADLLNNALFYDGSGRKQLAGLVKHTADETTKANFNERRREQLVLFTLLGNAIVDVQEGIRKNKLKEVRVRETTTQRGELDLGCFVIDRKDEVVVRTSRLPYLRDAWNDYDAEMQHQLRTAVAVPLDGLSDLAMTAKINAAKAELSTARTADTRALTARGKQLQTATETIAKYVKAHAGGVRVASDEVKASQREAVRTRAKLLQEGYSVDMYELYECGKSLAKFLGKTRRSAKGAENRRELEASVDAVSKPLGKALRTVQNNVGFYEGMVPVRLEANPRITGPVETVEDLTQGIYVAKVLHEDGKLACTIEGTQDELDQFVDDTNNIDFELRPDTFRHLNNVGPRVTEVLKFGPVTEDFLDTVADLLLYNRQLRSELSNK